MKDGFLLVNKEENWTAFDVCKKLSHKFQLNKIGHNGTLDPFATGLLLIASGDATKLLSFMENDKKTYVAKLILGKKTSTADKSGEVLEEKEINKITNIFNYRKEKQLLIIIINVYIKYINFLKENNLIDFNDMLALATKNVDNTTFINNYKYIIIDEFQDTSIIRFNLIKELH